MHSALLIGRGVELLNGDGEKGEDGGGLYLDRSSFTSFADGHYVGRLSGGTWGLVFCPKSAQSVPGDCARSCGGKLSLTRLLQSIHTRILIRGAGARSICVRWPMAASTLSVYLS